MKLKLLLFLLVATLVSHLGIHYSFAEEVVKPAVSAASSEVVVAPAVVAPGEPDSVADVAKFIPALIAAFKSGNWLLVGALVSLILTFLARKFVLPKAKIPDKALPLVSAVIGVIAGVGLAVVGGASLQAAAMAVLSGPLASALWSAGLKYLFPQAEKQA